MVKGLELFRDWFAGFAEQYVLIGGTAASITMEDSALQFRATRDLDVVLHVEALTPDFARAFWAFVEAGGYLKREVSAEAGRCFYRFHPPQDNRFPYMVELFARAPDALRPLAEGQHLTPIPFDEAVSSLSAILLDDEYYGFVLAGRAETNGVPHVREDRLIPLKALAWLEMRTRRDEGEHIDDAKIRKHLNDVIRLSQLLVPAAPVVLPPRLQEDMRRFLAEAAVEERLNPPDLGVRATREDVLQRLAVSFGIA